MNSPPRPIPTPCVKVCVVDGESGLCLGCFRTLPEIARWAALSDAERTAVMGELPTRRGRGQSGEAGPLRLIAPDSSDLNGSRRMVTAVGIEKRS